MATSGTSDDAAVPGLAGENTAGGDGVVGRGRRGVVGISPTYQGVYGQSDDNAGVVAESTRFHALYAVSHGANNAGVFAYNDGGGTGVAGRGTRGVHGDSDSGAGVFGQSARGDGVVGRGRRGVVGISPTYQGVYGQSDDNAGVVGESTRFHALYGVSHGANNAGVFAYNDGGGYAAILQGRVAVNGDITVSGDVLLKGADVAEQFDLASTAGDVPPGAVVVLDDNGRLTPCDQPYDPRVAGIVSGAGDRRPGLILDRVTGTERVDAARVRRPVAVVGKAWCCADARAEPISVGDLLTTSGLPGHAMRATDRHAAFGAVIGKALTPLAAAVGHVLVLVSLT